MLYNWLLLTRQLLSLLALLGHSGLLNNWLVVWPQELEALTTTEVVGHCLGCGGLLNSSLVLHKEMLMSRKNCFSPWALLLLCFLFISYNVKYVGSHSSLKHSDRGSCGSIPISFGPMNGRPRATMIRVSRLPSLTSFIPSEEPHTTHIGFEISNSPS